MSESITLEETNRNRIAAGLKPIPVPGQSEQDGEMSGDAMQIDEDPDVVAQRNYQEKVEQDKKDKAAKDTRERIAKVKNQLALNSKLKGSTLGAADQEGDDDALSWIKKSKKKQKAIQKELALAKMREEEQRERDLQAVYGSDDLRGLKVAHNTKDIDNGENLILTLKDSRILNDEEDELQNVDLADEERRLAAQNRKKRAKEAYTGYDDDEFEDGRIGGDGEFKARDVLSKYDDEYEGDGSKKEGFRLGGSPPNKRQKLESSINGYGGIIDDDDLPSDQPKVNRQLLNLDYSKNYEASDYATEDTTFKKKKRKVKRSTRRAEIDPEDVIVPVAESTSAMTDILSADQPVQQNLVDDDDLQLALSRQRRSAMMKRGKWMRPEDIAAQVAANREADLAAAAVADETTGDDGLTFDDTSEFIRTVTSESIYVKREPKAEASSSTLPVPLPSNITVKQEPGEDISTVRVKIETTEDDILMNAGPSGDVNMEDGELSEEDEELAEMALRQGLSLEEMRLKLDTELVTKKEEDVDTVATPDATYAGGMAGVLASLRQQGALKETTRDQKERERVQKERDLWLADHRRRIAKRDLERAKLKGGAVRDQAQREWEIKTREQQEMREALSSFADYKPDVTIEYTDEFGRVMTPKEAWKSLSHKFHGKTSGRKKTEQKLRRIEEERKRESMVAGDTPYGMQQAFAKRQEATGQAHMVLSIGNRNYVPTGEVRTKQGIVTPGGKSSQLANAKPVATGSGGSKKQGQGGPKVLG